MLSNSWALLAQGNEIHELSDEWKFINLYQVKYSNFTFINLNTCHV